MTTTRKAILPGMLLDRKIPIEHRRHLIRELCESDSRRALHVLDVVLQAAARGDGGEARYEQRRKELDELVEALESGPPRHGTFFGLHAPRNGAVTRAHVKLQDGTSSFPVVRDADLVSTLRCGDGVLLSARGETVLDRIDGVEEVGEEARLEAWLGDRVEVSQRSDERHVLHLADPLRRRLEGGEVEVGGSLVVCLRRRLAIDAVPAPADALSGFRFLSREPVPDVDVDRDVGAPPPVIDELTRLCRREMRAPAGRRRYGLRRCTTVLFSGVSGSGKTLCVAASIRRIYDVMAEVTEHPVEALPPRVIRLRLSRLLSQWLGQSDRNADRLVDEIVALADMPYEGRNGAVELPVIVVLEELDGIARRRGTDHDGIYDRIQTTLLQRLDHTANPVLRDKLVFLFATTNVPHLLDPAWIRRVSGRVVRFGRLGRGAFASVLDKQLAGRPLAGVNGSVDARRRAFVRNVASALYARAADEQAVVEIQLAGTQTPLRRHRRDFLTGSLVDRAVQRACEEACEAEAGGAEPGLGERAVLRALHEQVDAVVQSLTAENVQEFVDLPDGARVAGLRRPGPSALAAFDLERAAVGRA